MRVRWLQPPSWRQTNRVIHVPVGPSEFDDDALSRYLSANPMARKATLAYLYDTAEFGR